MASRSGAGSGGGVFGGVFGGGGRDEVPLSGVRSSEKADDAYETFDASASVSYTHLTLPTILLV